MKKLIPVLCLLCFCMTFGIAQNTPVTKSNYEAPSRFSPAKVNKMVFSTAVDAHWLKKGNKFWYTYGTPEGSKWYMVDAAKGSKRELFDAAKLAADITLIVKDPFDAQHVPIQNLKFLDDENIIRFEIRSTLDVDKKEEGKKDEPQKKGESKGKEKKVFYFDYNLTTGQLTELKDYDKEKEYPRWANISPDGEMVVFTKQNNLYWMDKENFAKARKNEDDSTIVEHQLTTDGEEDFSWGRERNETNVDKEKNKDKRKGAFGMWSPDSKHVLLNRTDERNVKELWVINSIATPRPTLETYKYHMPGEAEAPQQHLYIFDMQAKTYREINTAAFKDQTISVARKPVLKKNRDDDYNASVWLGTPDKFYLTRTSRDIKRVDICEVNVKSGEVKVLIEERLNTYVETRPLGYVNNGRELIQWSERTGWAHFYLYDGNGNLKNAITSGPYHCESIAGIDEANRVLYFTANGKEPNENPYYTHLYRVNFDGSGLKLLNAGDFDHMANMDDDEKFFIDNFSRVNTVPKSILCDNTGRKVMELETADLSRLFEAGYKFPEIFKAKADDGITDIYGVMYKPFEFDSTKKYPLIEYVYPGPQTEANNTFFSKGMDRTDRLAQFGFVVITLGNRGGHPARSKWYHNYGYGNLRDYGLADKKVVAQQLAARHKFIDIDKVGIQGHSGGGFMSTAAMLVYPDFFKVAVSNAGNHENNIYNRWWSEQHHGVLEEITAKGDTTFKYNIATNSQIAKNLKGHLMLTTGEIDNNVHPANTMRMVNALIRANKRFDLLVLPTQRHGYGDMNEYFFWRMGDYFCEFLLGDSHRSEVDIPEMSN